MEMARKHDEVRRFAVVLGGILSAAVFVARGDKLTPREHDLRLRNLRNRLRKLDAKGVLDKAMTTLEDLCGFSCVDDTSRPGYSVDFDIPSPPVNWDQMWAPSTATPPEFLRQTAELSELVNDIHELVSGATETENKRVAARERRVEQHQVELQRLQATIAKHRQGSLLLQSNPATAIAIAQVPLFPPPPVAVASSLLELDQPQIAPAMEQS